MLPRHQNLVASRATAKGAATMDPTVTVNDRDHVIGAADAPVTVVEYGDYESLECREMHQAIEKILRPLFKKVRLVYRHFPLVKVHPHALRAAEAAEAAAAQDKFWEMHTLLCLNPERLKDNDLRGYAKKLGLDLERFDSEMASGIYVHHILKNRNLSEASGISVAPTFLVNNRLWTMKGLDLIGAVRDLAERSTVA
jgi:protein-disulfide isomerase